MEGFVLGQNKKVADQRQMLVAIIQFFLFTVYMVFVIAVRCRKEMKFDRFSLFIVSCFILGFAGKELYRISSLVKATTWYMVSQKLSGEDEVILARCLEIVINGGFFMILDVFVFKM